MSQECLRVEHIQKAYTEGFVAIKDASLTVKQGEIHGLLGENGAGKSTFVKIISGLLPRDGGTFELCGVPVSPSSQEEAAQLGIIKLQKRSSLVPSLSVEENILLGRQKNTLAPLDRKQMRREISALLKEFSMDPAPQDLARNLTAEDALETELLKAYYAGAKLLILDEPASYFTLAQTEELFALLRKLAAKGIAILYVSNQIREMLELCENITVMEGGFTTGEYAAADMTVRRLQNRMVRQNKPEKIHKTRPQPKETVLKVRDLSIFRSEAKQAVQKVSFSVRAGEILTLIGKPDSGARELCEVISGLAPAVAGKVTVFDDDITADSVRGVRELGVSFLISSPQRVGVAPSLSIQENLLPYQYTNPAYRNHGMLDQEKLKQEAVRLVKEYDIRCGSVEENASVLSTSSAQKLLAAREFSNEPVLLVAYQPTFGTSEETAAFLEKKLLELRDEGTAILLVPTDLDEFAAIADSALVLYQGSVSAYLPKVSGKEELDPYINGEKWMTQEELEAVCFE